MPIDDILLDAEESPYVTDFGLAKALAGGSDMTATGLIAGTIMTWARAMAEFGPILFFCGVTQGRTSVMPVQMFLHFSIGDIERAVALVLIMLVISAVTLVTFKKLGGRGYLW